MPCVFCSIVAGELPAHFVQSDSASVSFLDRTPLFPGHVLVVPREHFETLGDLPEKSLEPFFATVRRVARALEDPDGLGAAGTFVAMNNRVSQSVPHLHCHVVPRRPKDGLRGFFWPRTKYTDEAEMARFAAQIRISLQEGDESQM